jgi:hypothetical protein
MFAHFVRADGTLLVLGKGKWNCRGGEMSVAEDLFESEVDDPDNAVRWVTRMIIFLIVREQDAGSNLHRASA